jgi:PAS domain S-box-containing protein
MFTVLVVDSDDQFLSLFHQNADSWPGVRIQTVTSVRDAEDFLRDNSCDIVVSEYKLPDRNGIDLLRHIRSRHGDIPFILLTGYGNEEVAAEASRYWICAYIMKRGDPVPLFSEIYGKIRVELRRKEAEEALRERESRCRTILESQPGLICRLGPGLELTYANRMFITFTGAVEDDLTGTRFPDYLIEDDRMSFLSAVRELTPENPFFTGEFRFLTLEPELPMWTEWTFTAAFDEHNRPERIHGTGRNISWQKEHAAAQAQQLENLAFLSKTAMELLDMEDTVDIFRYIAENLRCLLPPHTVISVMTHDLHTRTARVEIVVADDDVLRAFREWFGTDLTGAEFSLDTETFTDVDYIRKGINEGPQLYYFLFHAFPEDVCHHVEEICSLGKGYVMGFSSQGQTFGNIAFNLRKGVTIENSELLEAFVNQASVALLRWRTRKAAEEEIARVNAGLEQTVAERTADLQAANRNLESFSYSISHDLRAPLRAIDGFSSIFLNDYGRDLSPEGRQLIDLVRQNTVRMANLIDAILEFSRAGRTELRRDHVDMQALVREVSDEEAVSHPGQVIERNIEDLPPCRADPLLIRQVLKNLLSNAMKFSRTQEVTRIDVGSFSEDGHSVYFIRDNGIGFDPAYADRIFRVFERLNTGKGYDGTGIGLAIVDEIIRRHGGRVWAESEAGKGATFYFTIGV